MAALAEEPKAQVQPPSLSKHPHSPFPEHTQPCLRLHVPPCPSSWQPPRDVPSSRPPPPHPNIQCFPHPLSRSSPNTSGPY